MTTYEKIKALLELNTLRGVAVKRGDKIWQVFTHIVGRYLQGTYLRIGIEECFQSGVSDSIFTETDIHDDFALEIVPLPMKPKLLPVGTKVKILDIVKECGGYNEWCYEKKNFKNGVIEGIYDNTCSVCYTIDGYTFPSYCVVPDFDYDEVCTKEDTMERIVLNGKTYVLEE